MDVGYSTDSNSSWIINPRELYILFIINFKRMDYDEYHLKQEIKIILNYKELII